MWAEIKARILACQTPAGIRANFFRPAQTSGPPAPARTPVLV